jgi:Major Facilitator Superfamily.
MEERIAERAEIGGRQWAIIWFVGLVGQLLWNVENALFNTFAYRVAERDAATVIQWMVAASAIASTASTLLMGTWSDRAAARRPFIAFGYILWGAFTIAFGASQFLPAALVGIGLVVADTIMSFCGSIGNDAGFNAWTTDISNEGNRGRIGGAIAVMPIIATICGTAGFGVLIAGVKGSSFSGIGYFPFFILVGCVAIAAGVVCLFLVKDAPGLASNKGEEGYWRQLASTFDARAFKGRKELVLVFALLGCYFIAFNVYFPFMLPYLEHSLGLGLGMGGIVMGAGLGLAALFAIPAARFIDRGHSVQVAAVALGLNFLGLVGVSYASADSLPFLIASTLLAGIGYVLILQTLTAWLKNLYPESQRGQFEGIRLIFFVLIPMVVGPAIGTPIVTHLGKSMLIEGKAQMLPTGLLFRVSAVLMLVSVIPLGFAAKARAERISAKRSVSGESEGTRA